MARIITILLLFICSVSFGQLKNAAILVAKYETSAARGELGFDGTLIETASIISGKVGNCVTLDGNSDYVNYGNVTDFERTDPMTILMWINTDVVDASFHIHKRVSAGSGWQLGSATTYIQFSMYGTSATTRINPYTLVTINNGTWYHIAVTYPGTSDGDDVKIYFDGVSQIIVTPINTLNASILNSNALEVGKYDTFYWDGEIDEVYLYKYELNQTMIDLHYAGGDGRLYVWENFINKKIDFDEWLDYNWKCIINDLKYTT